MRYTYVRQHDSTDCAAASLAMVCLHYKKEITITRLRDMMGTDMKGTNLVCFALPCGEPGQSRSPLLSKEGSAYPLIILTGPGEGIWTYQAQNFGNKIMTTLGLAASVYTLGTTGVKNFVGEEKFISVKTV